MGDKEKSKVNWSYLNLSIIIFNDEQVHWMLQATNFKNKEVTANPNPHTLERNWSFKNP